MNYLSSTDKKIVWWVPADFLILPFSAYIDQNVSLKDRNQIEELMIKGDLIELHLEETTDLWNLLSKSYQLACSNTEWNLYW